MSPSPGSLAARFREALSAHGPVDRVVVAISGGLDSCVLLHLARFHETGSGHQWIAAHYDHRMRDSSESDARWVAGLCRAWDVPLRIGRAPALLASEEEAREARYAFLDAVRGETGASLVLTAHHADDQAETVLFRLLRGAGSRGLRGIPARRDPAIARPLLDFWRSELEEYAARAMLSWREDPTNRSESYARNALRNRILPDVERLVAPGARRALVGLASLAGDEEAAWESVLPRLMEPLDVTAVEGGLSFRRSELVELHPAVRARVLRALAARLGSSLGRVATGRAVDFSAGASSGRAIDLGGSLSLGVELERCVLARSRPVSQDRPLAIADTGPGRGDVVLAGARIPVAWGGDAVAERRTTEGFDVDVLRFPLVVRSRRPGDRIRLTGGTKKVKKVLLESRIPLSERHRVPLVVDAEGQVLWIPGLAKAEGAGRGRSTDRLRIGIG